MHKYSSEEWHDRLAGVRGFTLIELLVVVAIIAILSSIAAVNYMETATRARVSVVHNDLRVLTLALESYAVENHVYPPSSGVGEYAFNHGGLLVANPVSVRLIPLTTPTSYITAKPQDPLTPGGAFWHSDYDTYDYVDARSLEPRGGSGLTSGAEWRLCSAGPDGYQACGGRTVSEIDYNRRGVDYDPTNGTKSVGDIVRVGPQSTVGGNPTDPQNPNRPGNLRAPRYLEQWHR